MRKAILKRFLLIILLSLILSTSISSVLIQKIMTENTANIMLSTLHLIDEMIEFDEPLEQQLYNINIKTLTNDTRISIINMSGLVVADTSMPDVSDMENHGQRKEITEALQSGMGWEIRNSSTIKTQMLYTCIKSQSSDYIIRLAVPFNSVYMYLTALSPAILISILFSLLVSYLLAKKFTKTITGPLSEISETFSEVDENKITFKEYEYDELNSIAMSAERLSERVENALTVLKYEKNKIDYVLENMDEGLILLDHDQNVITINNSARDILNCPSIAAGKNIIRYTKNIDIVNGIENSMSNGNAVVFDMETDNGNCYALHISKIKRGIFYENMSGAIVLFIDVTADRNAQRIRQEFFSNASHELKTPITSIQGYVELFQSDMVIEEDQKDIFLSRIKSEVSNMTNIINDILEISRLESKMSDGKIVDVDVGDIIDNVVYSFKPLADERHININSISDNVIIKANPKHINQLVNNLLSNSIRYNTEHGEVNISAKLANNVFTLTVIDTGIGIPKDSINRVFERFYCVDKGRSRKVGGTGLGLSIVKHIVGFYKGTISIDSELSKGTKITISWKI